jgi:hypothetical protein
MKNFNTPLRWLLGSLVVLTLIVGALPKKEEPPKATAASSASQTSDECLASFKPGNSKAAEEHYRRCCSGFEQEYAESYKAVNRMIEETANRRR